MGQVKVQFKTPEEVIEFTSIVARYEYDMDLKKSTNKIVDAKSLLGVLALGMEQDLELCIHSDEDYSAVMDSIGSYIVS